MAESNVEDFVVNITAFYDPGLFWFIYEKDIIDLIKLRINISKRSQTFARISEPTEKKIVVVKYGDDWYRAEIADIRKIGPNKNEYICWLIDYGTFVVETAIFKLPKDIVIIPPYAKKAKLYGLRSITKEQCEADWAPGVRKCIEEIINKPKITLAFVKKFAFDDYVIGNLFINSPTEGLFDVKEKIIGLGLAKFDEQSFTSGLHLNKRPEIPLIQVYATAQIATNKIIHQQDVATSVACGRAARRKAYPPFSKRNSPSISSPSPELSSPCFADVDKDFSSHIRQDACKQSSPFVKEPVKGRAKLVKEALKNKTAGPASSSSSVSMELSDQMSDLSVASNSSQKSFGESKKKWNKKNKYQGRGLVKNGGQHVVADNSGRNINNEGLFDDACGGFQSMKNSKATGRGFVKDVKKNDDKHSSFGRGFVKVDKTESTGRGFRKKEELGSEKLLKSISAARGCSKFEDNDSKVQTMSNFESSGRGFRKNEDLQVKQPSVGRGFAKFGDSESQKLSSNGLESSGRGFVKNINKIEEISAIDQGFSKFEDSVTELQSSTHLESSGRGFIKRNEETETFSSGRGFIKSSQSPKDDFNPFDSSTNPISSGRGFIRKDTSPDLRKSTGRGFIRPSKSTNSSHSSSSSSKMSEEDFQDAQDFPDIKASPAKTNKQSIFHREITSPEDVIKCQPAGAEFMQSSPKKQVMPGTRSFEDSFGGREASGKNFPHARRNFRGTLNGKRPPEKNCDSSDSSEISRKSLDNSSPKLQETGVENGSKPVIKAGKCECDKCESCRDNRMVFARYEETKREPKQKTISKPALLFKPDDTDQPEQIKIKTNQDFQTEVDKLISPRLLVHGHFAPKPVSDLCNVPFHSDVHQALRILNYDKAYRIQSYGWPAIMRGHHIFVVSGPQSGKSLVYIPALCTFVLNDFPDMPDCVGPIAVVLCPGVQVAENVAKLTIKLMDPRRKKRVCLAVPPFERQQKADILRGVDILICTPNTLMLILKEKIISLKRLGYVVLEDGDKLFDLFPMKMKTLLNVFQKTLVKRIYNQTIQMIVVAQEWSKSLEMLAKKLNPLPLICIGSFLEAALYGRADIQIQIVDSADKPMKIIEIVADNSKILKTILVCNELTEIDTALKYLDAHGVDYELLADSATLEDIKDVSRRWSHSICGKHFVLVCSDDLLNTSLSITEASIVIQFSLPDTWSQFSFRFSSFMDNYCSPFAKQKNDNIRCKMYVFIDESNMEQFPRMIQFLKRMECNISENVLTFYSKLVENIESLKQKNRVNLCDKLVAFGFCPDVIPICKYRHSFSSELDTSKTIPLSGIIKLKILNIKTPTSFYCRLLEVTDAQNQTQPIKDQFGVIAVHLAKMMAGVGRKSVLDVNLGNVLAVEEASGVYRRCKIVRILKHGVLKRASKVAVRLIDIGSEMKVSTSNLYLLNEKIRNIPPQAVEVHIANLGPSDKDTMWSERCLHIISNAFKKVDYDEANCYFTGRIKFQIGHKLFVENLILQESLEAGALLVNRLSVKELLLKHNIAEPRPKHLENLYNLCKMCDFPLPDYSLPVLKSVKTIEPQREPNWAHLDNYEEFNLVYFCSANSPDQFYVKLIKNQTLFNQLKKDIADAMNKPMYPTEFTILEGRCYLVKDMEEDFYARVVIKKLINNMAECFFVDFGDFITVPVTELKFLPDELITQLPFQVIECRLHGIEPAGKSWLSEAADIFYDLACEPDTDLLRILHVKVISHEQPVITGYKKYSVILVDTFEADIIVNNVFLEMGYAVQVSEEKFQVDFAKLKIRRESESEEESDWENNNNCEEVKSCEVVYDEGDDDERWDFVFEDPVKFMQELLGSKKPETTTNALPPVPNKETKVTNKLLTGMKALPAPGYSTPQVLWHQTNSDVTLKIKIAGVNNYEVYVLRKKILLFKTICNNTKYRLDLNLFSKVESEIKHCAHGMHVVVTIKKQMHEEWPRLVSDKDKMRHISYNIEAISVENDSDDEMLSKDKFEESKKLGNIEENGPYIYDFGSDVDYNESDVESDNDSDDS